MKKFLIGVLLSFVMFALSLSLFSGFSFFIAIFPIAVLAVPFICAVTEALIFLSMKNVDLNGIGLLF